MASFPLTKKILDVTRRVLKLDLKRDGDFEYTLSALRTSRDYGITKSTMIMEHTIPNSVTRQPVYVTVEIPTVAETITSKGMSELTVKIEDSNTWPYKFTERVADLQASLRMVSIRSRSRSRSRSRNSKGRKSRNSSKRTKSRTKG